MTSSPVASELELAAEALTRLLPDVPAALADRLRAAAWSAGHVVESGQFHRVLVLDGLDVHVPKPYIYAAMGFSVLVEWLNLLMRRRALEHKVPGAGQMYLKSSVVKKA